MTSSDSARVIGGWAASFGSFYSFPPAFGNIQFAQAHRFIGGLVGALTLVLAVWVSRTDHRAWMRKLGWTALGTIALVGSLGAVTALRDMPPGLAVAHTTLAQTFFCLVVAIWLFCGRTWVREPRQNPPSKRPSIQVLTALSVTSIYVQLILGAGFRHLGIKLLPHVISATVVTFVVLWTVVRVLTEYPQVDQLRRPAIALLTLLMVQLGLGFATWVTAVQLAAAAGLTATAVAVAVAHVAVSALLLATAVVLAIQSWRHVAIPTPDRVPHQQPRAVAI